jgi:hypothetical protein
VAHYEHVSRSQDVHSDEGPFWQDWWRNRAGRLQKAIRHGRFGFEPEV